MAPYIIHHNTMRTTIKCAWNEKQSSCTFGCGETDTKDQRVTRLHSSISHVWFFSAWAIEGFCSPKWKKVAALILSVVYHFGRRNNQLREILIVPNGLCQRCSTFPFSSFHMEKNHLHSVPCAALKCSRWNVVRPSYLISTDLQIGTLRLVLSWHYIYIVIYLC